MQCDVYSSNILSKFYCNESLDSVFVNKRIKVVITRVGHRFDLNDSDSNSDSYFRFRFFSILDSDSLRGGNKTCPSLPG